MLNFSLSRGLALINFHYKNELPRRKQRGIFKSNERPKGRGIKPYCDLKNQLGTT